MKLEFLGKFYDNHSLSIVNRNIVLELYKKNIKVKLIALDSYDPAHNVDKSQVKILKELEALEQTEADIQVRHSYPPVWKWPVNSATKVVFIQPWEYTKAPFEWQYKFEQFADALIVPSNFCKQVFEMGGLNPDNSFVVPNGYNQDVFNTEEAEVDVSKFGIDKTKFNFVYVGNAQWRKGLDILLNAWSNIFAKADNARLIIKDSPAIYGDSNILNEIVKMQYKTQCAELVYLDQNLSEKDMAAIYKASKVVVHPYRAEGFGMHVQEAIACGCFPIVSGNGPTDDFIPDDTGIKLPVRKQAINIQDPSIFALKPGDAATLMSTHTFANEPSVEHLKKAMSIVYHSHDKEAILSKTKNNDKLNTWESVSNYYVNALTEVANRQSRPQRYL
jgi:glycosyltransferase involved in cell wall biosynthesis